MDAPVEDSPWRLEGFLKEFDLWVERDPHADRFRLPVLSWIQSRMDDPYLDVQREAGFDNLWFGPIHTTLGVDGLVVAGSYFVFEQQRLLRCNSFSTLSFPA